MTLTFDDPATYRIFSTGDTAGIPRFDHSDTLDHLRRLAPDRFDHLVAFQALNRMSTLATGLTARYIERRHGREGAVCELPALSPFFEETYGLPLYEEQLDRVAVEVGGLTPEAASVFTAAFSRFREELMPGQAALFVGGAVGNGTGEREAGEMISYFGRTAPFMLPRKRLERFAAEGYRLAWIKAHHRDAFEAARLGAETAGQAPGLLPLDISAPPK